MERKCKNCEFWFKQPNGATECRREPPEPMLVPNPLTREVGVNGFFPPTNPDIWCGEFVRLSEVKKFRGDPPEEI